MEYQLNFTFSFSQVNLIICNGAQCFKVIVSQNFGLLYASLEGQGMAWDDESLLCSLSENNWIIIEEGFLD